MNEVTLPALEIGDLTFSPAPGLCLGGVFVGGLEGVEAKATEGTLPGNCPMSPTFSHV